MFNESWLGCQTDKELMLFMLKLKRGSALLFVSANVMNFFAAKERMVHLYSLSWMYP